MIDSVIDDYYCLFYIHFIRFDNIVRLLKLRSYYRKNCSSFPFDFTTVIFK